MQTQDYHDLGELTMEQVKAIMAACPDTHYVLRVDAGNLIEDETADDWDPRSPEFQLTTGVPMDDWQRPLHLFRIDGGERALERTIEDCVLELAVAITGNAQVTPLREIQDRVAEAQRRPDDMTEIDWCQAQLDNWWRHHAMAMNVLATHAPAELARLRSQYPEFNR